jgi:nucleotide-binding universal stress UspA family protein
MRPIRTILYATDFSTRSSLAFHFAISLARDSGARLIVLHVRESGREGVSNETAQELRDKLYRHHAGDFRLLTEHRLAEGDPAETILRTASEDGADLIVVASRGRDAVDGGLLGRVAERVLREARCPVVLIKAPAPAAQGGAASPSDEMPAEFLGNDVVFVTEGVAPEFAGSSRVYHRDFPEVVGEGGTPVEGARHLRDRLAQAREYPQVGWKLDVIERAIRDVEDFRTSLAKKGGAPPCPMPTGHLATVAD